MLSRGALDAGGSEWLLIQGQTIKEAAAQLDIGFYTADEYIRSVYEKLQVRSRGSAVAKAVKEGLV